MCVTESVCSRGCEYIVCVCTCIRERGEAEGTCLGEGRDINHAKSNLAPWEFIRIQLKSMGSFMRQFSSHWLRGLFELSSSLGQRWLRAPPVLTPVHEKMRVFHVSSSEMTHFQGLCEGVPWPPSTLVLQLRTASSRPQSGGVYRGEGPRGGWPVHFMVSR